MADPAPDQTPAPMDAGSFTATRRAAMLSALTPAAPVPTPDTPAPTPVEPAKPDPTPAPQPDEAAAIRKQEIHFRRQMAEERAKWQAEQERALAEYKPKLTKLEEYEARIAAAQDDPIAFLEIGGWTSDKLEQLARLAYAHSPEGAKNPANKVAAHQTKAQRDLEAQVKELKEKQTAWERQVREREEQARIQAQVDNYFATVTKAVSDESPIVKARLAAMPDAARERMLAIADRLYTESGPSDDLRDVPEPAAIIKAYEQERRSDLESDLRALPQAELAKLVASLGLPAVSATPAPAPKPSPTLTPNAGTPTQTPPKGRLPREQLIAEVKRLHSIAKP